MTADAASEPRTAREAMKMVRIKPMLNNRVDSCLIPREKDKKLRWTDGSFLDF